MLKGFEKRQSSRPYLAFGALAVVVVLWGYNWVVQKPALRFTDAATFAALRVSLAAVCLFLVLVVLRRPLRPTNFWLTLVVGMFGVAGSTGLSTWALKHGAAGKTSVLVYTMPVWVLLMSRVFLGERLRGAQWLAVGFSLAGLCLVITPWSIGGTVASKALAVGAGVSWAGGTIAAKVLSDRRSIDLISLSAWQMLFGAIPLGIIALATSHSSPQWTGSFIAALVYNVIFAGVVTTALWFYALRALPAGTTGIASLGVPVIGVIAAWVRLGERPDRYEAVGICLIISALAVLTARQMSLNRVARPGPEKKVHDG